jgi:energy-converting hydrogenase A subunit M
LEELSYYFNGDLENFLSSKATDYKINFNKFNQEFEFFIAILDNKTICTNRKYSDDYITHLNQIFKVDLKTSTDKKKTKLWCCDLYNLKSQREVNSRFFTQKIANKFNPYKADTVSNTDELEEGYLYKEDFSVSGNGNYRYPKDKLKIEKRFKTTKLIKDKLYDRDIDISTLIEGTNVFHYENLVDDHFQYRGSLIGKDLSDYDWFREYQKKIDTFLDMDLNIEGPYSIDSFIYDNNIYFMTEINNRKTMGYISKRIKDLYFSRFKYLQTVLIPTRKIKRYNVEIDNVYLVSPKENLFGFFIIVSDSLKELKKKELNLYARVYN